MAGLVGPEMKPPGGWEKYPIKDGQFDELDVLLNELWQLFNLKEGPSIKLAEWLIGLKR